MVGSIRVFWDSYDRRGGKVAMGRLWADAGAGQSYLLIGLPGGLIGLPGGFFGRSEMQYKKRSPRR